ncbi:hypothetical protein ACWGIN_06230 [Streptomyces sp. NPDC054861]
MRYRVLARAGSKRPAAYVTTVLLVLSALLSLLLPAPVASAAPAAPADEPCGTAAVAGINRGTLEAADEVDCFVLPFPAGAVITMPQDRMAGSAVPAIEIVDGATGTKLCEPAYHAPGTCKLVGAGPHHVKVRASDGTITPGVPYGFFLRRVDEVGGCPVFPAGDFTADTAEARFSTADGAFAHCVSIPASDHSEMEIVQARRISGAKDANVRFWVVDDTGRHVCDQPDYRNYWARCDLAAGRSYSVVVAGHGGAGAFGLVRRDVTATARGCETGKATAVGGPAAVGTFSSWPGAPVCRQVTTDDARDVLYVNERDGHNDAYHAVFGPKGQLSCNLTWDQCAVSGATRYQAIVTTRSNSSYASAPFRLDVQRIRTPDGPAPECARPVNISYGYGPLAGRLDEEHTAVCAALPTYTGDAFDAVIEDTESEGRRAVLSVFDVSVDQCTDFSTRIDCSVGSGPRRPKPTVMVLGLAEWSSRAAYSTELVCAQPVCGADEVAFTALTPAVAASGTKARVTVSGTALRAEHRLRITHPSGTTVESTTLAVSADRRSMTAEFDLTGAPVGAWSAVAVHGPSSPQRVTSLGTFAVTKPGTAGLGLFQPLTPTRLMDTRVGIGVPKAKVGPGGTVTLQAAGVAGIPASGVTAVVLNVTATAPTAAGFVSVYPAGTARTSASNLNFSAGQTIPNLVVVPVVNGKVSFYNRAGSVDLLADVAGYYTTAEPGSTYKPVTPTRLMDTRAGIGVPKAKVGPGGTVTLQAAGAVGIPASGVTAVVLNVTATAPTAAGFVSVYPDGTTRTSASNLNFTAGTTIPNLVIVPVVNGKVSFYNRAGSVDLLADVAGYFTTDGTGSGYEPVTPTRLMDTRTGLGVPRAKVGADRTVTLQVAGRNGVPDGVTAVVLNVTATAPTAAGFVSVYPDGTTRTSASNLNFTAGTTIPNLVIVPVVNGKVSFYNRAGSVDLLADIAGYYTG